MNTPHSQLSDDTDIFPLCSGQDDAKCASRCYNRIRGGKDDESKEDAYWAKYVGGFMEASRAACNRVSAFLAPSPHLASKFIHEFGLEPSRVHNLNYGFDRSRLAGRTRAPLNLHEPLVFGFVGRHIAVKGIHHLIEAFAGVIPREDGAPLPRLVVWGRDNGQVSVQLKELASESPAKDRIEFRPGFANEYVVPRWRWGAWERLGA